MRSFFAILSLVVVSSFGCSASTNPSRDPTSFGMPTSERSQVYAKLKEGQIVFAQVQGSEMKLLLGCSKQGSYKLTSVPVTVDRLRVKNGAWLEGDFKYLKAGIEGKNEINLSATTVGTYLSNFQPPSASDCLQATHYVAGASVGAFTFEGLDFKTGEFKVGAEGKGVKLGAEQLEDIKTKGGDPLLCPVIGAESPTPPSGCNQIIKIDLAEISGKSSAGLPGSSGVSAFLVRGGFVLAGDL